MTNSISYRLVGLVWIDRMHNKWMNVSIIWQTGYIVCDLDVCFYTKRSLLWGEVYWHNVGFKIGENVAKRDSGISARMQGFSTCGWTWPRIFDDRAPLLEGILSVQWWSRSTLGHKGRPSPDVKYPDTVASVQRSFSELKLQKNYLLTTTSQAAFLGYHCSPSETKVQKC